MQRKNLGFSAIEIMVVMAILVILAMIAIPSSLARIVKTQVAGTIPWADVATEPIEQSWKVNKTLPPDNTAVGLPSPEKIVSNFVTSLTVKDGAIHMTLGNKVHPKIKDKVLTIRPAVVEDSQVVPIAWVCGNASPPPPMVVKGDNMTSIPDEYLPQSCR
jgi:type IV pilus assembly protein PilA